ncbi:MAG: tail fiber protein [Bacteroidaceae bacterium]|nr:tail fiber protein [Bacteroidaceae bacterium]
MDKITGNYLGQPNKDFPLDCETLQYIADNAALTEVLGNVCGDKVILYGCKPASGGLVREEGYVFLRTADFPNGEILRWEGGSVSGGTHVEKQDVAVTAQGYNYPKAYTKRWLAPGMGTENFSWSDFRELQTMADMKVRIADLQAEIESIVGEPYGIVKMWAGTAVPAGYALCDGSAIGKEDNPRLFEAIGTTFNLGYDYNGTRYSAPEDGKFRLPDLRGRFIVGRNDNDTEYQESGKVGGEKKHALTVEEMPAHVHPYKDNRIDVQDYEAYQKKLSPGNYSYDNVEDDKTTSATGGNTAHENRPPYYVLAYIIKLG